jgi:capsular exopolysaccharide synthesis family protein
MAQSGRRVLLVDGDLRRSRVHEIFSEEQSPGIVDLLAETAESPQVIRVVEETGLHIIPSGTKVVSPQDVLGSEGMKEFLAWARQHYDLVVVDTPPVNVVSETLHLASVADRVILLVKWSTTHRDIVVQARRHLDGANARYAGAVLSQVGPKADSGYSYSGYSGYGRAYRSYYHEG